jgi:hypothetical protein
MSDFLNEEIKRMNFLLDYKKGVVISEQSLENTPVGKVGGEELGKAPSDVVKLMKMHLENSDSDVVDWCDKMKQKHGEGVCVIGKSMKMNIADTKRGTYEIQLMREKYKKVEEGPNLMQDENKNFYKVSYMIPKA